MNLTSLNLKTLSLVLFLKLKIEFHNWRLATYKIILIFQLLNQFLKCLKFQLKLLIFILLLIQLLNNREQAIDS